MSDQWSESAVAGDATAASMAEAKLELTRCDQEIANIKTALRHLGQPSDSEASNTLKITWIKVEGLPEEANPKIFLQLSSPVETAELTKVLNTNINDGDEKKDIDSIDTNNVAENDAEGNEKASTTSTEEISSEPAADATSDSKPAGIETATVSSDEDIPESPGSIVTFSGVETGQATLSVEAMDLDIPLGSSIAYDLAPFTSQLLDPMGLESDDWYSADLPIAILPAGSNPEKSLIAEAVCTVTLKLSYQPSVKDKREGLYELLNKASEKKAAAVEKLRQSAMDAARSRSASKGTTVTVSKPAVKPGFLNKKEKAKETSRIMAWYDTNLGPNSLLRRYLPIAKNYILFFAFLTFSHFKGHILALPQPV